MFTQLLSIGQLLSIKDDAQLQRIKRTFTEIIQNEQYYLIFDNYIEYIIAIFSTYFDKNDEAFLDLIFNLLNPINNPEPENTQINRNQEQIEEIDEELKKLKEFETTIIDNEMQLLQLRAEIENLECKKKELFNSQTSGWNLIEKVYYIILAFV